MSEVSELCEVEIGLWELGVYYRSPRIMHTCSMKIEKRGWKYLSERAPESSEW